MTYRHAELSDVKLYFDWANDPEVRAQSHNTEPILWESHVKWFNKIVSSKALMLVFFEDKTPVGQLRIDPDGSIGFSVDPAHRGKGIGTEILKVVKRLMEKGNRPMKAEVKQTNTASLKAFENAGFKLDSVVNVKGVDCSVFTL